MGEGDAAATHPFTPSKTPISSPLRRRGRGRTPIHPFPKGSKVEVRTDDDGGFKGAYFTATVLRSTSLTPKKRRSTSIYVEYDNLERLRQHVKLSDCRPAPPPISILKPFEPDDVVDAFYRDGWCPGFVTRVIKGGQRYVVTFPCPPDELEFDLSDLRVHSDWVNGTWVRPQKQRIAGLMFCLGRKVEVSFDRENCRDAWFPGTIHEDLENGAFLVEYQSASTQTVKETVKDPYIRPCPPLLKCRNFDLLEKVDAFFDYGWWAGVVTKEHGNGRYTVFFKQMNRDKDFNQSELRPHVEWKDGKWFTSSQLMQGVRVLSFDIGMHEHHKLDNPSAAAVTIPLDCLDDRNNSCDHVTPSSVTTVTDHCEKITPDKQKTLPMVACMTKGGKDSSVLQIALSQPNAKEEAGVGGTLEQDTLDRSANKPSSASQTDTSWGKRTRRSRNANEKVKNCTPSSVNGSSVQTSELENPNLNVEVKEPDAVGNVVAVQNEHAKNNTGARVILGLPCADIGNLEHATKIMGGCVVNSRETKYFANDKKRQLIDSTAHKMKDNKILENREQPGRRKRGRPKKIPLSGILSSVTDSVDESSGKANEVNKAMEIDKEVCEAPNKDFDDEPLSKWIEGIQSPPSSNGSRPSPAATINQCTENGKNKGGIAEYTGNGDNQLESEENTPDLAPVATGSIVISEAENLPFVKNTFLWQTIESMEVFRKMPQKPHFKPLEDIAESSREGLAIGYMVTFSSVVERTRRLHHDDPESVTEDIMRTLADLERHGFDVKVVQECISECVELRKKQKKIVVEMKMLKDQMLEQKQELIGVDEELKQLHEKIALAEATKKRVAGEIACLEAEATSREEVMKRFGSEFQSVASSLLQ